MFINKTDIQILELCKDRFHFDARRDTFDIYNMNLLCMVHDYPTPEVEDEDDFVTDFEHARKTTNIFGDNVDDEPIRKSHAWFMGDRKWRLNECNFRNYQIFNTEYGCSVYFYPERSHGKLTLERSTYPTDDFQIVYYFQFTQGRELPYLNMVGVTHEDCSKLGSPFPTGNLVKAARK